MDTKTTCEICERAATEDNPVETLIVFDEDLSTATLACDGCVAEIGAMLAVLSVLR